MELSDEQQAVLARAFAPWDTDLTTSEREKQMSRLAANIEVLSAPLRSVFILRYVKRINVADCAKRLGMTTADVQKHVLAALRALRDQE